jgi:hypothetical protein
MSGLENNQPLSLQELRFSTTEVDDNVKARLSAHTPGTNLNLSALHLTTPDLLKITRYLVENKIQIATLDLSCNDFDHLPADAFSGCYIRRSLDLSNNLTLTTIQPNAFSNCSIGDSLVLSNNLALRILHTNAFDGSLIRSVQYDPNATHIIGPNQEAFSQENFSAYLEAIYKENAKKTSLPTALLITPGRPLSFDTFVTQYRDALLWHFLLKYKINEETTLPSLPNEIWLKIFSFSTLYFPVALTTPHTKKQLEKLKVEDFVGPTTTTPPFIGAFLERLTKFQSCLPSVKAANKQKELHQSKDAALPEEGDEAHP